MTTLRTLGLFSVIATLMVATLFITHNASAAGANELIKCSDSSAVYLLGEDGKRYAFPNERIYFTWHEGFDQVNEVTCADLSSVAYGGVVRYRPGVRLIKIPSVPKVYAVESNGVLRPIQSEEQARKLYGDDWATRVDDLSEAFFPRYTLGAQLGTDELPEGMILEDDNGALVQVDDDGELIEIDGVLSSRDKALLRRHSHNLSSLENRIGRAMDRISDLESQIERLQRQLRRQKAVHISEKDKPATRVHVDSNKETKPADDSKTSTGRDDGMPDFVVKDITVSSSGAITATVGNQGTADSPSDMGVYFWFDEVLEWTYNTSTLSNRSLLDMGGSSTISPQRIMDERVVTVCADANSQVSELDESNNCRTETLTGPDGDFDLTVGSVDAIDALGNADETVRSFGFNTTGPLDHYRIRIWDSAGNLHDELLHQIIGATTVQAYYVSPSWLTPLNTNSTYTYEVHAEEYHTGDADTETGSFTTGANASSVVLTAFLPITGTYNTYTRGENEAWLGTHRFSNSSTQDIQVTSVTMDIVGDDDAMPSDGLQDDINPQDHFQSCWMQDDTGINANIISDIEGVGSDGTVVFNNLSWIVPPMSPPSFTFMVFCNLSATAVEGGNADAYAALINSTSDIEAEYVSNGDAVLSSEIAFDPVTAPLNANADFYIMVVDEGPFLMQLDGGSPIGVAVKPGASSAIATYRAASTYEDMSLDDLYVFIDGDVSGISSVTMELAPYSGSTVSQTSFLDPSTNIAAFTNLNWDVTDSQWGIITVSVDMLASAQSGSSIQATINPSGYAPRVIGDNSGAVISAINMATGGPILANNITVQ
jgi:hypothetical protein